MAAAAATTAAAAAWRARSKVEITVRRAREADFEGVAGIRGMIVPVGMSGATGFLGGKVVIDDPEEAKRRVLMAKVRMLLKNSRFETADFDQLADRGVGFGCEGKFYLYLVYLRRPGTRQLLHLIFKGNSRPWEGSWFVAHIISPRSGLENMANAFVGYIE